MFDLKKIEYVVKSETATPASIVHDFGHLCRVAEGAAWFVRALGGNEHAQSLARAAGFLHDIIRPAHDRIDHVLASTARAEEILKSLSISGEDREEILRAVRDHRGGAQWQSVVHESVFFADKVFEQMGAALEFRRGMWLGECQDIDWSCTTLKDTVIARYTKRLEVVRPERFNPKVASVVAYQLKWLLGFLEAFKADRPWAVRLNRAAFEAGKARTSMEDAVRNYKPGYVEDANYKEEAMAYIDGKLYEKFEKMLK